MPTTFRWKHVVAATGYLLRIWRLPDGGNSYRGELIFTKELARDDTDPAEQA